MLVGSVEEQAQPRHLGALVPADAGAGGQAAVLGAELLRAEYVCDDLPATVARRRWRGSRETIAQVLLPWMHPDDLGPVGAFARGPADETTYLETLQLRLAFD